MSRKHQQVASRAIIRETPPDTDSGPRDPIKAQSRAVEANVDLNRTLKTVPEKIARHRFYYRNHHIGALKDAFPGRPHMWTVDLYFPHGEDGPFYFEEASKSRPSDLEEAKAKAAVLRKIGLRCLVVTPDDTEETIRVQLIEGAA